MRKLFGFLLSCLLLSQFSRAQQLSPVILSPAGDADKNARIQLQWTLGENAVETGTSGINQYTQGFHQPLLVFTKSQPVTKPVIPLRVPGLQIQLAPNPVQSVLHVQIRAEDKQALELQVVNLYGVVIQREKVSLPVTTFFNLNNQSAGIYLLRVLDEKGTILNSHKIVKTN